MEVTCERCNTDYEFDDALVSEQGTSVRCTTCGHKFRVKRETGNAPEIWVVRTVDGRELEFRALRELKGAITTGRIGRDDVLSRGVGRPRRLASIAELEPFFVVPGPKLSSTAMGLGDGEPRPRSRTPHGLGPYVPTPENPREENSVAFSLPKLAAEAAARELGKGRRDARADIRATSVGGTPMSASAARLDAAGPESIEPETSPRQRSSPARESAATSFEEGAVTSRAGSSSSPRAQAVETAAAAASMHIEDEVTHAKPRAARKREAPSPPLRAPEPTPSAPEPPPQPAIEERPDEREAALPPAVEVAPPRKLSDPPQREPVREEPVAKPPPVVAAEAAPAQTESEPPPPIRSRRILDSEPPQEPKLTPTPAETRFSITSEDTSSSDPRYTAFSARSGSGSSAARLLVGFVVVCGLGFAVILGVRYLGERSQKKTDASGNDRVTAFLTESDKLLREGDVDAASDQLVKASALSDSDPRLLRALARIANIRAELPCLRADILLDTDAERETATSECKAAADKAGTAIDRALAASPDDPETVRAEIDQKRLAGDVSTARKLVTKISSLQSQPETAFVLAALELHESSPVWQSVMDRLSSAAAAEGDLGRARALLVYALARSGDVKAARAELDKIARMTKPHPLKAALGKFLDRADKGEMPAARVDDLPSASSPPIIGSGALPTSAGMLGQAHDALARHDLARAETLYQTVLEKEPNNTEALAGLAAVARASGNTARADALYKKSLESNNGYVPALASEADLKWESGQKDAAADLYARVLELDPTGPNADRARSRIAERNAENASHPDTPPTSTPTSAPTVQPTPTSTPLPSDVPLSP